LDARQTHPSRTTGPFFSYDTESFPHQPRKGLFRPFADERGWGGLRLAPRVGRFRCGAWWGEKEVAASLNW
jgi:hypothetical protein